MIQYPRLGHRMTSQEDAILLRAVAPPEITTRHIYVGIIPFVLIQLFALIVLWFVPGLATWLPHRLYGG
jgi:TRAP-type mannitol/chloroaromatic compound transport system permease large subunit